MTIRVLDPELVSKIAAGEVIERPASVVKELVENSLDAGSTQVTIEVVNGGLTLIRVTDNGHGIPPSEVELAFQRHATSKLKDLADLETIRSLGFRGEALPSISAVADVEIITAARGEVAGTCVKLSDGAVVQSMPKAHPTGTTMTVYSLFHTTPARLKFMKSARAESARIAYLVSQFALAFPEVRFALSIDGRTTLRTSGSGDLRDAAAQVYGGAIAREMLGLVTNQGMPKTADPDSLLPVVTGLVSPPHLSRSNRTYVSFFVNRRWVFDRTLSRALDEAYLGRLMVGRQPMAVISITLSPAAVDVNVHPTKREVRFRHENLVFSAVNRAVKRALEAAPVPQVGLDRQASTNVSGQDTTSQAAMPEPQPLWRVRPEPQLQGHSEAWGNAAGTAGLSSLRVLGQIDNTYIVAESPTGLYLVDQHAAHERVLFDSIKEQRSHEKVEVQGLLPLAILELAPEEEEVLKIRTDALLRLGFSIEPFGDRSYLVRTVPAMLTDANIAETLHEILASPRDLQEGEWYDRATASLACHGAIKAGQRLDGREAVELLRQLERTASPRTCPHGRPTMIHLSSGELRRHFGRE